MDVKAGSTDVTTYFALRLAADGTDATGLTITNIDLQYIRSGAAPSVKVDATALAAVDSAHGDNQAIEIDATDQPGLYRVDWPDAAFAAGVREVILTVKCATAFTEHLRVNLTPVPADTVLVLGEAPEVIDNDNPIPADIRKLLGEIPGLAEFLKAIRCIGYGTVGASSTTTSVVASAVTPSAGAVDCFKGRIMTFDLNTTTAALRGQSTDITANTSGATPTFTVTALTTAPVSGDIFTVQ